jgi:hypothetical protein
VTAWLLLGNAIELRSGHAHEQQKKISTRSTVSGCQLARVQHVREPIGVSSAAAMYTVRECMWSAMQKQAAIALSVCASPILTLNFWPKNIEY